VSRLALGLALLWIGAPAAAPAQGTAGIAGQLVDRSTGAPLAGAAVTLLGTGTALTVDTLGRFSRANLRAGTYVVQVRALGYRAASWVVDLVSQQTLSLVLELEPVPVPVTGVTVEGRPHERGARGFEERRSKGRGVFITEVEIARAQSGRLGDVLRTTAGVREVCRGVSCQVRMTRSPTNCAPNFFLDGVPANNATTMEMPAVGVVAIEVYRTASETPVEFLRGNTVCGVIVIWTRVGL
jgi:hypothetical protein